MQKSATDLDNTRIDKKPKIGNELKWSTIKYLTYVVFMHSDEQAIRIRDYRIN